MTQQLKVGDVVMMNSGGPKMTVRSVKGQEIGVAWFTEAGYAEFQVFSPEMLKLVAASLAS